MSRYHGKRRYEIKVMSSEFGVMSFFKMDKRRKDVRRRTISEFGIMNYEGLFSFITLKLETRNKHVTVSRYLEIQMFVFQSVAKKLLECDMPVLNDVWNRIHNSMGFPARLRHSGGLPLSE